jgi:quercetin dioxygenase-like cupin family protein
MARMKPSSTFAEFEVAERTRGCSEVLARSWQPNQVVGDHTHPFDARALVVAGEMWLTVAGETQHLRVGDRFELAAGTPHSERYGAEGATYWVARTNA